MALILLTNDDGIDAEGLRRLERGVHGLGKTVVVAPDRQRSAVSHGLTIDEPLSVVRVAEGHYTINGTPADCVIYAVRHLLERPPDLIISGINHGANLGDDIMYSGTVAAAREASYRGIAALAVSQAYDHRPIRFHAGEKFIRKLVKAILEQKSDGGICLNINFPVRKIRGVKITRQGCASRFPHFNSLDHERADSLFSSDLEEKDGIPLDFQAIMDGYVSVTPLQRDQTDYITLETMTRSDPEQWNPFGIELIGRKN